jgi:hypothetical protein
VGQSRSAAGFFPAAVPILVAALATATAENSAAAENQPDWRLPQRPLARELRHEGVVIKVTALLVEPVTGFLIARGFSSSVARNYAATCVIRVVMSNESAHSPISYDLRSWRTRRPDGALGTPLAREDWLQKWQTGPLSDSARMGFEWSQLPTLYELYRGDSTQGMVNTGLSPGSRFDLQLEWKSGGKNYQISMEGIDCAPPS